MSKQIITDMELDDSGSHGDSPGNHGDQNAIVENTGSESKGTLTTVASTYFDQKISVPDSGGVS